MYQSQRSNTEISPTALTGYERRQYQRCLVEWIQRYPFEFFVTLTFAGAVSKRTARSSLDEFQKHMARQAYGSKRALKEDGKRMSFVASLERQPLGRPHWHLLIQPFPKEHNRIESDDHLAAIMRWEWARCGGSNQEFNFQRIRQTPEDIGRVSGYVMKEVKYETETSHLEWFYKRLV